MSVASLCLIFFGGAIFAFWAGFDVGWALRDRNASLSAAARTDAIARDLEQARDAGYQQGFSHGLEKGACNEREAMREFLDREEPV